jgi:hypothetical protein
MVHKLQELLLARQKLTEKSRVLCEEHEAVSREFERLSEELRKLRTNKSFGKAS